MEANPQNLTLAFTPEKTGNVNFSIAPDWAGVGRVAGLTLKGATWAGAAPAVPADVVNGGKTISGYIAVTAGTPVEINVVVTVREEWPLTR